MALEAVALSYVFTSEMLQYLFTGLLVVVMAFFAWVAKQATNKDQATRSHFDQLARQEH